MAAQNATDSTSPASNAASPNIDVNSPYTPRRPAPLVSISINHPIATAFKKLKNFLTHKQTLFSTSFTIKITPIVAIVSLFGLAGIFGGGITTSFNFGRTVEQKFLSTLPTPTPKVITITPLPQPVLVTISRAGAIKATYQWMPASPTPPIPVVIYNQTGSDSGEITPTTKPTATPTPQVSRYILQSRNGSITFLAANKTVNIQHYMGHQVLVTGIFDSTKNILTITKQEDIEILQ